jgi:hypothetical protein
VVQRSVELQLKESVIIRVLAPRIYAPLVKEKLRAG